MCMCTCVVVCNNLNCFCLLYSSKFVFAFYFSVNSFFLFKIVTCQSASTMVYYLCFVSEMFKCYKF